MSRTASKESEVQEAFTQANSVEPTENSWGFFAYDDAPGGIGGGSGMFCWFESRDKMCDFIERYPLLFQSSYEPEDDDKARIDDIERSVRAAIEEFRRNADKCEKVLEDINRKLRRIEQIKWWGSFSELLSGDHWFAKELRSHVMEGDGSSALPEEQREEFVEFLQGYGY